MIFALTLPLQVPLKLHVQSGGDWGINISLKRIERLTYKFGKIGINLRLSKILNYQLGNLPTGNILKNQRVVIAVDGGRTKIRINKQEAEGATSASKYIRGKDLVELW